MSCKPPTFSARLFDVIQRQRRGRLQRNHSRSGERNALFFGLLFLRERGVKKLVYADSC